MDNISCKPDFEEFMKSEQFKIIAQQYGYPTGDNNKDKSIEELIKSIYLISGISIF